MAYIRAKTFCDDLLGLGLSESARDSELYNPQACSSCPGYCTVGSCCARCVIWRTGCMRNLVLRKLCAFRSQCVCASTLTVLMLNHNIYADACAPLAKGPAACVDPLWCHATWSVCSQASRLACICSCSMPIQRPGAQHLSRPLYLGRLGRRYNSGAA